MSDATSKLPTTTLNHSPAAVSRGLDSAIASPDCRTGRGAEGGGNVRDGVSSGAGNPESDGSPSDRNDSGRGIGHGAGGASGRPGLSIPDTDVVNGRVDMTSSVRVAAAVNWDLGAPSSNPPASSSQGMSSGVVVWTKDQP